jgi:acyl carrier protein
MRDEIRQFLVRTFGPESLANLSDEDSLLSAGVIDSVAMIDLISHLEKTYTVRIAEDDMTPENFDSIAAIATFIESQSRSV